MLAMFISFSFMLFLNMISPLGFFGGALVVAGVYFFLTKLLNFKGV
jgi:hypothetical protein